MVVAKNSVKGLRFKKQFKQEQDMMSSARFIRSPIFSLIKFDLRVRIKVPIFISLKS